MTMRTTEISDHLDELEKELEEVRGMTEKEACDAYMVNSKNEAIAIISEEITALERYQCEYDDDDYDMWDDHGFASEADYIRWRYGA